VTGLERFLLDHRFDHELTVGHVAEIGREVEPRRGVVAFLRSHSLTRD